MKQTQLDFFYEKIYPFINIVLMEVGKRGKPTRERVEQVKKSSDFFNVVPIKPELATL